ncbi:MAG: EAL domain-containing protein [Pyrinomonadaceae bacterium]|nr:EAL domain-containing protein [Pyrinomonadaceae bacterium]
MENKAQGLKKRSSILIIDDEEQVRCLLGNILAVAHECTFASSAEEAMRVLKAIKFDLVISDINMGGVSGLDLVPYVLEESPETVVVMISGQQSIDAAIQAMRAGAFDYITKPFGLLHVEAAVTRALAHQQLLEDRKYYESHLQDLVRQRTAEVERLAYFDTLTDLPNRVLFEDRLTEALKRAQRDNRMLGVSMLRVDRFKKMNDAFGHILGDRLLRDIAQRIQTAIGDRGTLARFEGDEFALLHDETDSSEKLLEALRHLNQSLQVPFVVDGHELFTTVSLGISLFPTDGETPQELLKNAGVALDRAKSLGGNTSQFYRADMNARALERLTMEAELRRAMENKEFILYYQPQVDLVTNRIVGAEALIRWQHPQRGLLLPADFISLAEDSGLILQMGEWALRAACTQATLWRKDGLEGLRVSVNVSPHQFQQDNFVETVAQILAETAVDPATVDLEITETSIMENADRVVTRLSQLQRMGLRIAIDDFGIGYSSLGYLKRLPIDMLKIDRTFVSDATTDPDDAALVMTIITLAHNLRLKVMAEGVETEEQLRFLRLLKCDEGQGYFFGKPWPPGEFFTKAIGAGSTEAPVLSCHP